MEQLANVALAILSQLQSPTLAFLIAGMAISAVGSKLEIPDAIYRFIVFMLLMKIGLKAGIEVDGGVSPATLESVASAGANIFVAGSAIFGQPDYQQVITRMKASFPV